MAEMLVYLSTMLIALRILLTIAIVLDCLRIKKALCTDISDYHEMSPERGPHLGVSGGSYPGISGNWFGIFMASVLTEDDVSEGKAWVCALN
jgi:hypothetical protein